MSTSKWGSRSRRTGKTILKRYRAQRIQEKLQNGQKLVENKGSKTKWSSGDYATTTKATKRHMIVTLLGNDARESGNRNCYKWSRKDFATNGQSDHEDSGFYSNDDGCEKPHAENSPLRDKRSDICDASGKHVAGIDATEITVRRGGYDERRTLEGVVGMKCDRAIYGLSDYPLQRGVDTRAYQRCVDDTLRKVAADRHDFSERKCRRCQQLLLWKRNQQLEVKDNNWQKLRTEIDQHMLSENLKHENVQSKYMDQKLPKLRQHEQILQHKQEQKKCDKRQQRIPQQQVAQLTGRCVLRRQCGKEKRLKQNKRKAFRKKQCRLQRDRWQRLKRLPQPRCQQHVTKQYQRLGEEQRPRKEQPPEAYYALGKDDQHENKAVRQTTDVKNGCQEHKVELLFQHGRQVRRQLESQRSCKAPREKHTQQRQVTGDTCCIKEQTEMKESHFTRKRWNQHQPLEHDCLPQRNAALLEVQYEEERNRDMFFDDKGRRQPRQEKMDCQRTDPPTRTVAHNKPPKQTKQHEEHRSDRRRTDEESVNHRSVLVDDVCNPRTLTTGSCELRHQELPRLGHCRCQEQGEEPETDEDYPAQSGVEGDHQRDDHTLQKERQPVPVLEFTRAYTWHCSDYYSKALFEENVHDDLLYQLGCIVNGFFRVSCPLCFLDITGTDCCNCVLTESLLLLAKQRGDTLRRDCFPCHEETDLLVVLEESLKAAPYWLRRLTRHLNSCGTRGGYMRMEKTAVELFRTDDYCDSSDTRGVARRFVKKTLDGWFGIQSAVDRKGTLIAVRRWFLSSLDLAGQLFEEGDEWGFRILWSLCTLLNLLGSRNTTVDHFWCNYGSGNACLVFFQVTWLVYSGLQRGTFVCGGHALLTPPFIVGDIAANGYDTVLFLLKLISRLVPSLCRSLSHVGHVAAEANRVLKADDDRMTALSILRRLISSSGFAHVFSVQQRRSAKLRNRETRRDLHAASPLRLNSDIYLPDGGFSFDETRSQSFGDAVLCSDNGSALLRPAVVPVNEVEFQSTTGVVSHSEHSDIEEMHMSFMDTSFVRVPVDVTIVGEMAAITGYFWCEKSGRRRFSKGPVVQFITGREGVGKTHLATRYAADYQKRYSGGTFVFDAKTRRLLDQSSSDIVLCSSTSSRPFECFVARVRPYRRILLVWDDADGQLDFPEELCSLPCSLHVLVTSSSAFCVAKRLKTYNVIKKLAGDVTDVVSSGNTSYVWKTTGSAEKHNIYGETTEGSLSCSQSSLVVAIDSGRRAETEVLHWSADQPRNVAYGEAEMSGETVTHWFGNCFEESAAEFRQLVGYQPFGSSPWHLFDVARGDRDDDQATVTDGPVASRKKTPLPRSDDKSLNASYVSDSRETVSVLVDTVFSQELPGSCIWEADRGRPACHLAINVFSWCGCKPVDHSQYGISTTWYQLPFSDPRDSRQTVGLRGPETDTSLRTPQRSLPDPEEILVQVRKFGATRQLSSHPLITRLCLNLFVVEIEALLNGDSHECHKLFSLASLLASMEPVEGLVHLHHDVLPLLIVGLTTDGIGEIEKTEFEMIVSVALKGLLSRIWHASSERACFYVRADGGKGQGEDGVGQIRSILRTFARSWKPEGNRTEREIALLKRRQREISTEASGYFDTQRGSGLSVSDIENQLTYFHEKGVLFYPPGLRAAHILFNLDWLCQQLDTFLNARPTAVAPRFFSDLTDMREAGVTKQEFIAELINKEISDPLKATLLLLMDHYGICLQPQSQTARSLPVYVDSTSNPPSRVTAAAMSRSAVVVPHLLPSHLAKEVRTPRQDIAPLAIQSKDREVPYLFFSKLSSSLLHRFPVGWQLSKTNARFSVEPGHVLEISYNGSFIVMTMTVCCRGMPTSPKTAVVCDTVKRYIEDTLKEMKRRYRMSGLRLDAVGLKVSSDESRLFTSCDFLTTNGESLSKEDPWLLYDDKGQDFEPPETLFMWFNLGGESVKDDSLSLSAVGETVPRGRDVLSSSLVIKSKFSRICQAMDVQKVLFFLQRDGILSSADVDYCREPVSRSFVSMRLLRFLHEGGAEGGRNLKEALLKTGQEQLAFELWSTTPSTSLPQSLTGSRSGEMPSVAKTRNSQQEKEFDAVLANWNVASEQHGSAGAQAAFDKGRDRFGDRASFVPNPSTSITSSPRTEATDSFKPQNRTSSVIPHDVSDSVISSPRRSYGVESSVGSHTAAAASGRPLIPQRGNVAVDGPILVPQEPMPRMDVLQQGHELVQSSIPSSVTKWSTAAESYSATSRQPLSGDIDEPQIHPIFEAKYYHIERATDQFNDRPVKDKGKRLGAGSFGTVYHGVLHSENGDKFEVAIKRLKKASSLNPAQVELSRKQFGTEMNILTRYVHRNIVQLIGFSSDGPELCLIYEFMQWGALSHRLDCKDATPPLEWRTRLTIAKDLATGIDFLHHYYKQAVIHRDVKSSNVLLGARFEAKLSDFGLAILAGDADQRPLSPGPSVGTRPYMPPEAFQGHFTTKIDVYGFGMILYELATGLPPYSSKKKQNLKTYIDDIQKQRVDMMKMLDPKAKFPRGRDARHGLDLLDIAREATALERDDRPSMRDLLPRVEQLSESARTR